MSTKKSIELCMNDKDYELIKSAAHILNISIQEFILKQSCNEATYILTEQREFVLNDEEWNLFQVALNTPPKPKPRLEKLMKEKTISEI